jgi:hypothetical protein
MRWVLPYVSHPFLLSVPSLHPFLQSSPFTDNLGQYCDLARQFDPRPSPNTTTGLPNGTIVPPWEGGDIVTSTLEKWGKYDLLAFMKKYWKSRGDPGESYLSEDESSRDVNSRLGSMAAWYVSSVVVIVEYKLKQDVEYSKHAVSSLSSLEHLVSSTLTTRHASLRWTSETTTLQTVMAQNTKT